MRSAICNTSIGREKHCIETPALLIDVDRMEQNIDFMAKALNTSSVNLRPHFKTHKSPIIAHKQLLAGAIGITCAKLSEAEVLIESGIQDILIANQIVQHTKIVRLANLAKHSRIIVAADSIDNLILLSKAAQEAGSVIRVLLEIDVGLGRCGVRTHKSLMELVEKIQELKGLHFSGMLGYEGQAVLIADRKERQIAARQAMSLLVQAVNFVRAKGIDVEIVSAGGTGTFDITGNCPGITEIEAGSYIFLDTQYQKLDIPFHPALTLLTTIIHVSGSGHAVMDAGMKCLSTDNGLPSIFKSTGINLVELNEEHGILCCSKDKKLCVGDQIELIPSHVCTTVNLHDYYFAIRGDKVEGIWPIAGRGKFI
jgi:D-serine deaminase-like pyridoxal phosphate-dependent protein